jgi:peptidoglycan L-alanyl-D-glutamate endopeptidase CwlK
MLVKLVSLIGLFMCGLAWVGWRFFVVPPPPAGNLPESVSVGGENPAWLQGGGDNSVAGRRWIRSASGWRQWAAVLVSLLAAGMIASVVFALSGRFSLDPLRAFQFQQGEHIQSMLNPEELVVPPPLPPSMFVNAERPELETADRDWGRLEPEFARGVLVVLARMGARGYPMVLLEGYRSPERQDRLASSAVRVTNARAFQSRHQFGLAADLAPVRDGHLRISEQDPWAMEAYRVLGEEAQRAGLVWGGRWSLKDYGHVEAAAPMAAISKK